MMIGALLAAMVAGTLIYELIGGLLFPLADTGKPFSVTWETRLLAAMLIAIPSAVAAVALSTAGRQGHHGTSKTGGKPT
jgi:hypothetical protein